MEYYSQFGGCPMVHNDTNQDGIVMSTNWEYLDCMKMNEFAPSPNLAPVKNEATSFTPWFWPDDELADSVKVRRSAFLNNPQRVLATANENPVVRAASQQLLWLQAQYLSEHFPDKYAIEQSRKLGRVIVNMTNSDKDNVFSMRPEKNDWHPLAISGMLGQEDICIVKRKKSGRHVLVAGFLASPTHWNLSDFMKADMDKIHEQVVGYHHPVNENRRYRLKDTVDKVLNNMREYPDGLTWRNNQFIEYIPSLALEPDDATTFDEKQIKNDPGNSIFLRSERETLARLPQPYDDFTIFTIKPHVFRLADVRKIRGDNFARAIATNLVLKSALKSEDDIDKNGFNFTNLVNKYFKSNNT